MPHVVSLSVSMPSLVRMGSMEILTPIVKEPSSGPVFLGFDGPVGNRSAVHPEAVYGIGAEAYEYWATRLGLDASAWRWGHMGENITFSGLFEKDLRIGDVVEIGDELVLQVSAPRNPCNKWAWRLGQPASVLKTMVASGVLGFYFRVLTPGHAKAGDAVRVRTLYPENMAVGDIPRLMHDATAPSDAIRAALDMPALSDYPKVFLRPRLAQAVANETTSQYRWKGWREFTIRDIVRETSNVSSFIFAPVDGGPVPGFRPGQFLTVALPAADGDAITRQWSLSDHGRADGSYRVSVKREANGAGSGWLHDTARVGDTVRLKAPAGQFHYDYGTPRPAFLISAGIGITPLFTMLKAYVARPDDKKPMVFWIHGTRNGASYPFREDVNRMLKQHAIPSHIFYSRPGETDRLGIGYDTAGRLTTEAIKGVAGGMTVDLGGRILNLPGQGCDFYICGPDGMQRQLRDGLIAWGVGAQHIHVESFLPPKDRGAAMAESAEVVLAASGLTARWHREDGVSLLEIAEALGIDAQSSCRFGSCHSCLCQVTEGRADHTVAVHNVNVPEAHILPCSAVPASDRIVLDL